MSTSCPSQTNARVFLSVGLGAALLSNRLRGWRSSPSRQPLPIACSCDAPLFCRADRPVTTRAWLARCGRRRLDIARPERREDRRPAVPRSDRAGAATPPPPQHVGRDRRRPPDESADLGEPHVGERLADAAQPRHRRRFPKRHQPARSRSSVGRTLRCRRGSGPSSGNVAKSKRRASNEVGEGPGQPRPLCWPR